MAAGVARREGGRAGRRARAQHWRLRGGRRTARKMKRGLQRGEDEESGGRPSLRTRDAGGARQASGRAHTRPLLPRLQRRCRTQGERGRGRAATVGDEKLADGPAVSPRFPPFPLAHLCCACVTVHRRRAASLPQQCPALTFTSGASVRAALRLVSPRSRDPRVSSAHSTAAASPAQLLRGPQGKVWPRVSRV